MKWISVTFWVGAIVSWVMAAIQLWQALYPIDVMLASLAVLGAISMIIMMVENALLASEK